MSWPDIKLIPQTISNIQVQDAKMINMYMYVLFQKHRQGCVQYFFENWFGFKIVKWFLLAKVL